MFLEKRLGIAKTVIRSALRDVQINQNNDAPPLEDRRGKHEPKHKINHKIVHEHVEKYKPSIPHDRREHAPLRSRQKRRRRDVYFSYLPQNTEGRTARNNMAMT
ncbi:hypothetical protein RRG08_048401 [Elysia crispata]|uniref:Uncharacterized protein n=1 Tax=Elysia crispata TaxID=231223 RepID=A0AAE1B9B6_9GAST|nr:hypothetical protein RRG08_048401 [Elysia crispata]